MSAEAGSAPAPAAAVQPGVVPEGFETVTEGAATVLFSSEQGANAFYNKVQVRNRDLSILVLNEFSRQLAFEAEDQIERRRLRQPWRKIPATWDVWGRQVPAQEPKPEQSDAADKAAAAEESGQEGKDKPDVQPVDHLAAGLCGMRILEALAASGLRSVRYIKEIVEGVGIEKLIVNDLEAHAVESIKRNAAFNGLTGDERFVPSQGDGTMLMYKHRVEPDSNKEHTRVKSFLGASNAIWDMEKDAFDVIDLDPYGSPAIFMDSAVQAVRDGGLLCVTATDLPTLCGKNSENCFAKYRAMPLKVANYPHEMAIRMLLGFIESKANVYNRHIVPILSVHMNFYIRVFVRVYTNRNEIKRSATKLATVFHSRGCESFWVQRLAEAKERDPKNINHLARPAGLKVPATCPETGADLAIGGPIWAEPMHNPAFINVLLEAFEQKRPNGFDASALQAAGLVQGVLLAVSEELHDVPLFYSLPAMCKVLHCTSPPLAKVQSALVNAGYRYSQPHSDPTGIKTDAPPQVMWDMMRAWVKKKPIAKERQQDPKVARILANESATDISFVLTDEVREKMRASNKMGVKKVAKWGVNPEKNWGPKARAAGTHSRQTHKGKGASGEPAAKRTKLDVFKL